MSEFVQKSEATQQTVSAKPPISDWTNLGQSPEVNWILHLQQTIGNQAVQRLLEASARDGKGSTPEILGGSSPTTGLLPAIQRKSLTQAGLDSGLTATTETRLTVGAVPDGGGISGKVYDGAAATKQANKASAIRQAAIEAGNLGARVDTWGRTDEVGGKPKGKSWTPPRMFTKAPGPFNDQTVPTLDPFFHRITVPYSVGEADHRLVLVYQHGSAFQGYVAHVTDTGSLAAPTGANMYHGKSNKASTTNPYSDQHVETDEKNILAMTEGSDEESIDAYTKLAGEGARWQCVRDNASRLSNDSYFYCQDPRNKDSVLTVRFDELWVSWASHFGKRYNIANAEVILQLRRGLGTSVPKSEISEHADVNLEA